MSPAELASNIIAIVALVSSLAVYFLGKRHADRLFKSKEYPEVTLRSIEVWGPGSHLTDLLRHGEGRLFFREQISDHRARLELNLENVTGVKAVDLEVKIVLAQGWRQVNWVGYRLAALESGETKRLTCSLNYALSQLRPDLYFCRSLGKGEGDVCRWLEVPNTARPSAVRLLMNLAWRAPLAGAPPLHHKVTGVLEPTILTESLKPTVDQFGRARGTPIDLQDRKAVTDWKLRVHERTKAYWFSIRRARSIDLGNLSE